LSPRKQPPSSEKLAHGDALATRARTWQHARQAAVCDSLVPWAHGSVVRSSPNPDFYAYNLVRVEDDPGLGVDALIAVADEALAGLAHRRLDLEHAGAAARLRPALEARGWSALDVVWMRLETPLTHGPDHRVDEVAYDAVGPLRDAWEREDDPAAAEPALAFRAQARAAALARGARVLAAGDAGQPVGFAELDADGGGAEITELYVLPHHRGRGLGEALVRAAVTAAGPVDDLWIAADAEGRAQSLYARLGFRAVCHTTEFVRRLSARPAA
jgi:GNAT superfamily N-acetyltransferase